MQLFYGRFISCWFLIFPVTAKNPADPENSWVPKKNEKETSLDFKKQAVFENSLFFLAKKANGPEVNK